MATLVNNGSCGYYFLSASPKYFQKAGHILFWTSHARLQVKHVGDVEVEIARSYLKLESERAILTDLFPVVKSTYEVVESRYGLIMISTCGEHGASQSLNLIVSSGVRRKKRLQGDKVL
jgi:hypothetical protein